MKLGTNEPRRRGSTEELGGNHLPTSQAVSGVNAVGFAESQPAPILRKPLLPLAPNLTPNEMRHIVDGLAKPEAVSLMRTSRGFHDWLKADRWFRLDEISHSFRSLGYPLAVAAPVTAVAGFSLGRRLKQKLQTKEKTKLDEKHAQEEHNAQLAMSMQKFEPDFEKVVFHFASLRGIERPKNQPIAPLKTVDSQVVVGEEVASKLRGAFDSRNVELIRIGMREFFALPARLFPSVRKVAWLREPMGWCPLEFFGQYACDNFSQRECKQYEAIKVYIDEIVSSKFLTDSEKRQLCVKLALNRIDPVDGVRKPVELDVVRHAMSHKNPAVAACDLLGIYEATAEPELKRALLAEIAASWGGLRDCVDDICKSLEQWRHLASDQAYGPAGLINRLKSIHAGLPEPAELKV